MLASRTSRGLAALLAAGGLLVAIVPALSSPQGFPQPTEHHERIVKSAGEYEGTMRMWQPGMDEATESPCTESVTAIGRLWTVSDFQMSIMGMPFHGSATLGYDPEEGKYVGTWVDGFNSKLTLMEGEWDEEQGAIVMEYEGVDPTGSGEMVTWRNVTTYDDEGYEITFYVLTDDGPERQMQIDMHRADGGESDEDASMDEGMEK